MINVLIDLWVNHVLHLWFMPYFIAGKTTENELHECAKRKGA
jgi:hypothetical protein